MTLAYRIGFTHLKRQIVLVLPARVLRDPQGHPSQHHCDVLRHVRISIVAELLRVVTENVLQNQNALGSGLVDGETGQRVTHYASSQPPSHEGKPDKQEQTRPPDRARVSEALIPADPVLVDDIDDEEPNERADARDPVDERNMHRYVVAPNWLHVCRQNGGIEKHPVGQRELGQMLETAQQSTDSNIHQGSCDVHSGSSTVLSKREFRERIEADAAGVVVGAR